MSSRYAKFLLLNALLALGCGGNAVDVGHSTNRGWADVPAQNASPTTPQTIYASEEAIFGFALDDDTLYALITHDDAFELVSCPLDRCLSERKVLFSGPFPDHPSPLSTPLVLSGGWLYWIVANGGTEGVAACPTNGCTEPRFVPTGIHGRVTGDAQGGAYWFDSNASLMRITPEARAAERVRDLVGEFSDTENLAVQGDYVYFNDLSYATSSVRRVRKDGTSTSELVVTDDMITAFSVTADAIYYASQILTGHIVQCPLDDCSAGGNTLVANQRWPEEVQIHGNEAFWLTHHRFSNPVTHAALSSCMLPDCASVKERLSDLAVDGVVPYQQEGPKYAVGSRAIIWLEQFPGSWSSLRRLPR